jgi:GNAT superfamily N-acetyltransferase
MSQSIRRAREEDHARISEIRDSVTENKLGEASRPLVDNDYPWFRDNPGVWLWEENGIILGFAAADTRDGSIWGLFVAPGHERRGIGRALFEKSLHVLRLHGHCTAWLTTQPGSTSQAGTAWEQARCSRWPARALTFVAGCSRRPERRPTRMTIRLRRGR